MTKAERKVRAMHAASITTTPPADPDHVFSVAIEVLVKETGATDLPDMIDRVRTNTVLADMWRLHHGK